MSEKRGILTHFAGLIRVAVVVLVVLALSLLFIRWATDRRAANRSERDSSKVSSESKSDSASNDEVAEKELPETEEDKIPSGIAESDLPRVTADVGTVPTAGINTEILLTVGMIAVITYLVGYNLNLKYYPKN